MKTQEKKSSTTAKRKLLAEFFDLPLRDVRTRKDGGPYPYDTAEHMISYRVDGGSRAGEYVILTTEEADRIARLCALQAMEDDLISPIPVALLEQIGKIVCQKKEMDFESQIRFAIPDCSEEQTAELLTKYRDIREDPRLLTMDFHFVAETTKNNQDYLIVEV